MSPRNFHLELTAAAEADYRSILAYTERMWGARQVDAYDQVIDNTLTKIAAQPEAGQKRAGLTYLSGRAGKHLIFYRLEGARVIVLRILHEKMDFTAHLDEEG